MSYLFEGLEPKAALKHFWNVSQVYPRVPGHTQTISNYLADFGRGLGLEVEQDAATNVIIRKPATPGYENAPSVMLASHMDMICEKNPGVDHDFFTQPIEMYLDGDFVRAKGTTLGADNGLGMAFAMAVLESTGLEHPAIEAVFTADEETSMNGAWSLNYSGIQSRIIYSLDAARLSLGGNGELEVDMTLPRDTAAPRPGDLRCTLTIGGLMGGHSGNNAYAGRGNAVTLLARVLADLRDRYDLRIVSFQGGEGMSSSIARNAGCTFQLAGCYREELAQEVEQWQTVLKNELAVPDPAVSLTLADGGQPGDSCSSAATDRLLNLLCVLPDGLLSLNKYFDHKMESCVNVGVAETREDHFWVTLLIRSALASKKYALLDRVKRVCHLVGAAYTIDHDLPQWDYHDGSQLIGLLNTIYGDLPANVAQGTCELGVFLQHMPGAEAVGVSPLYESPHSPNEFFSVSGIARD